MTIFLFDTNALYQTNNQQGTTTDCVDVVIVLQLYQTNNQQGTTTAWLSRRGTA